MADLQAEWGPRLATKTQKSGADTPPEPMTTWGERDELWPPEPPNGGLRQR